VTKDALRRFTYEISPKAMRSLQSLSAQLCDAAKNPSGAKSISPLIQAIGSGIFSIVPRSPDASEAQKIEALGVSARLRLTEIGTELGDTTAAGSSRDPYLPKQCGVYIDQNAHWGMKSIANTFACKTTGGCRRRLSVSVLLNELGLGIHAVLPIPDIQIRYLYLQSEPLIQEYLAVKTLIDINRRKFPAQGQMVELQQSSF
jgi:hypothetical protein